jgi:hypothetical protein
MQPQGQLPCHDWSQYQVQKLGVIAAIMHEWSFLEMRFCDGGQEDS